MEQSSKLWLPATNISVINIMTTYLSTVGLKTAAVYRNRQLISGNGIVLNIYQFLSAPARTTKQKNVGMPPYRFFSNSFSLRISRVDTTKLPVTTTNVSDAKTFDLFITQCPQNVSGKTIMMTSTVTTRKLREMLLLFLSTGLLANY